MTNRKKDKDDEDFIFFLWWTAFVESLNNIELPDLGDIDFNI